MQILAIEKELKALDATRDRTVLREEAAQVWRLKKTGVLRDIWFAQPDRTAVLMLECPAADDARRQLATLPLVREGFIAFTLLPLQPYDGLDRLLS